jgi:phage tail-like protein
MSDGKAAIRNNYPLPAYNYRVTIMGDGQAETIGFSEVGGLSMGHDPVTYKDGFSFAMGVRIIPGMPKPIGLTLKKGLTKNGDYLQKWIEKSYQDPFSSGAKRDMVIDLCDEGGIPVIRWTATDAMPVKLDAPTFSASSNEVAIASMELVAARLKVEYNP